MIACVSVLRIDPAWRVRLRSAGLDSTRALMDGDTGRVFKRKPGLEVRRVALADGTTCYLKRTQGPPLRRAGRECLRAWRRARMPHTEAFHVARSARTLGSAGVATMPIAAWGERRWMGVWPVRGFVLAGGVEGVSAAELFRSGDSSARRELIGEVGRVVGRLHAHGLFVVVRLHDLIATRRASDPGGPGLVMIDLDFKGHEVRVRRFEAERCAPMLAQCVYLLLRGGDRVASAECRAFLSGYAAQLRACGVGRPRGLLARVRSGVRDRLLAHHRDERLAAMFPGTPAA